MSSDQIQPDFPLFPRRNIPAKALTGRAWVRFHLDFWERCTIEECTNAGVIVVLDNTDECTVAYDDVQQCEIEPGQLVFANVHRDIGGAAGLVASVSGESAQVTYPHSLYPKAEITYAYQLCDLRFYDGLEAPEWKVGTRVFAYRFVDFKPPLYLMYPAIVRAIHFGYCVEVEFLNGEMTYVPTTLIESFEVREGDMVYTCTTYYSHGQMVWSPCRVLKRHGEGLVLQDGSGQRFEAERSMVAILPRGYQMLDGKFERIPDDSDSDSDDVHLVRTDRWQDAADNPIRKQHVDELVESDPDLAWSIAEPAPRQFAILWKGEACFWWDRNQIRCNKPDTNQLAKFIDMATQLDANVIGHNGGEIH